VKKELISDLIIDFASPVPVYEQLKRIIKYAIAKGTLAPNEHMPSIRELASFLTINPNTVARAYRELSQTDVISGRAGKGFWVSNREQEAGNKREILKDEFLKFLEKAVAMGFSNKTIKQVIDEFFEGDQSK
jgi:GntR family transcriptional regulator